ncbi:hypothetical protein PPROV_000774400 [Pycnococcus provasolii]|uniref:Uncharacterized protein n=1 Tax=Pycnococcus provasolii TaxID=41880 RepID=A0A830HVT2_9CHLO|nr:hypothetical protein PPROV_000774400 [Pycnococcus provasolii]
MNISEEDAAAELARRTRMAMTAFTVCAMYPRPQQDHAAGAEANGGSQAATPLFTMQTLSYGWCPRKYETTTDLTDSTNRPFALHAIPVREGLAKPGLSHFKIYATQEP